MTAPTQLLSHALLLTAPLAISLLAAAALLQAGPLWLVCLLALAVALTLPALSHAFQLARQPHAGLTGSDLRWMQAHLLAHALPIAYMLGRLFADHASPPSSVWVAVLAIFFYTGRRTWSALRAFRPGKMYFIFNRGNTAMLAMTLVLTLVAKLFDFAPAAAFVERVLDLYIAVHFMLVGVAVRKIDHDLHL